MSNYLQRLAASAIRPGGNIRPLLDSTFATPMPPVPAPAPLEGNPLAEEIATAPAGARAARPAPRRESYSDSAVRRPIHQSSEPAARADVVFAPIVPVNAGVPPVPATRAKWSADRLFVASEKAVNPPPQESSDSPNSKKDSAAGIERTEAKDGPKYTQPSIRPESHEPAVAPLVEVPAVPDSLPIVARQAAGITRTKPALPSERPSEPDEIQIHIGRIEVTAVPPVISQPAPARPRRLAPSLKDYLQPRHRRMS